MSIDSLLHLDNTVGEKPYELEFICYCVPEIVHGDGVEHLTREGHREKVRRPQKILRDGGQYLVNQ